MQVLLNATYSVDRDSRYFEVLPFLIDLINDKDRRERKQFGEVLKIRYFPSLEFELGKCKMEDEKCMICLEEFTVRDIEQEMGGECDEDVLVLGCSHKYHKACVLQLIAGKHWAKCPICSTIFGHMTGDQPPGKVTHQVDQKLKCSGYPSGTIVINYQLTSGTRNGKPFQGTTRKAYLPDTPEGRGVL